MFKPVHMNILNHNKYICNGLEICILLPHVFHLQNPEPQDFYPKKGPRSGGTLVTITGLKMDTGRYITAQVAGRRCRVDRNM